MGLEQFGTQVTTSQGLDIKSEAMPRGIPPEEYNNKMGFVEQEENK